MATTPVETTLMSTRPIERTLAAPERLDLESRTAFRRAAGEVLDVLAEGAGRLVAHRRAVLDPRRKLRVVEPSPDGPLPGEVDLAQRVEAPAPEQLTATTVLLVEDVVAPGIEELREQIEATVETEDGVAVVELEVSVQDPRAKGCSFLVVQRPSLRIAGAELQAGRVSQLEERLHPAEPGRPAATFAAIVTALSS